MAVDELAYCTVTVIAERARRPAGRFICPPPRRRVTRLSPWTRLQLLRAAVSAARTGFLLQDLPKRDFTLGDQTTEVFQTPPLLSATPCNFLVYAVFHNAGPHKSSHTVRATASSAT
eukprot:3257414-Pleurochrysis_carterae.AAC.1